jgi:hypothetical protein
MVDFKCEKCGKTFNARNGMLTSWGGRYHPFKFFCFRCMKKMQKEDEEREREKWRAIAREVLKDIPGEPFEEMETNAMLKALSELCTVDGWYSLKEIASRFQTRITLPSKDVRYVSHILNRLGFKQRKRKKRGSFMHVYISLDLIGKH